MKLEKRGDYLTTYLDRIAETCPSGYHLRQYNWDQMEKSELGKPSASETDVFKEGDHAAMLIFGYFHGRLKDNDQDPVLSEAKKIASSTMSTAHITGLPPSAYSNLMIGLVEVTLSRRINEIWST